MKVYFDCEFTGLYQKTMLLSMGFVCEKGTLYIEFVHNMLKYQSSGKVNPWIQKNVLDNMSTIVYNTKRGILRLNATYVCDWDSIEKLEKSICNYVADDRNKFRHVHEVVHNDAAAADLIREFFKGENVELVSDVSHYDMMLLCELFGGGMQLPSNIPPCCLDINQRIYEKNLAITYRINKAGMFKTNAVPKHEPVVKSLKEAFDYNREILASELIGSNIDDVCKNNRKHNSLYDAFIIYIIDNEIDTAEKLYAKIRH